MLGARRGRRGKTAGFTVIEVTIALAVLCSAIAISGSAFVSNLSAVRSAQRTTAGALFLETVLQDLSAQPYDALLAFDGNTFHDEEDAGDSAFRVQLTVFRAAVDLLQVRATLTDVRSDRELGRVTTLRARR